MADSSQQQSLYPNLLHQSRQPGSATRGLAHPHTHGGQGHSHSGVTNTNVTTGGGFRQSQQQNNANTNTRLSATAKPFAAFAHQPQQSMFGNYLGTGTPQSQYGFGGGFNASGFGSGYGNDHYQLAAMQQQQAQQQYQQAYLRQQQLMQQAPYGQYSQPQWQSQSGNDGQSNSSAPLLSLLNPNSQSQSAPPAATSSSSQSNASAGSSSSNSGNQSTASASPAALAQYYAQQQQFQTHQQQQQLQQLLFQQQLQQANPYLSSASPFASPVASPMGSVASSLSSTGTVATGNGGSHSTSNSSSLSNTLALDDKTKLDDNQQSQAAYQALLLQQALAQQQMQHQQQLMMMQNVIAQQANELQRLQSQSNQSGTSSATPTVATTAASDSGVSTASLSLATDAERAYVAGISAILNSSISDLSLPASVPTAANVEALLASLQSQSAVMPLAGDNGTAAVDAIILQRAKPEQATAAAQPVDTLTASLNAMDLNGTAQSSSGSTAKSDSTQSTSKSVSSTQQSQAQTFKPKSFKEALTKQASQSPPPASPSPPPTKPVAAAKAAAASVAPAAFPPLATEETETKSLLDSSSKRGRDRVFTPVNERREEESKSHDHEALKTPSKSLIQDVRASRQSPASGNDKDNYVVLPPLPDDLVTRVGYSVNPADFTLSSMPPNSRHFVWKVSDQAELLRCIKESRFGSKDPAELERAGTKKHLKPVMREMDSAYNKSKAFASSPSNHSALRSNIFLYFTVRFSNEFVGVATMAGTSVRESEGADGWVASAPLHWLFVSVLPRQLVTSIRFRIPNLNESRSIASARQGYEMDDETIVKQLLTLFIDRSKGSVPQVRGISREDRGDKSRSKAGASASVSETASRRVTRQSSATAASVAASPSSSHWQPVAASAEDETPLFDSGRGCGRGARGGSRGGRGRGSRGGARGVFESTGDNENESAMGTIDQANANRTVMKRTPGQPTKTGIAAATATVTEEKDEGADQESEPVGESPTPAGRGRPRGRGGRTARGRGRGGAAASPTGQSSDSVASPPAAASGVASEPSPAAKSGRGRPRKFIAKPNTAAPVSQPQSSSPASTQ